MEKLVIAVLGADDGWEDGEIYIEPTEDVEKVCKALQENCETEHFLYEDGEWVTDFYAEGTELTGRVYLPSSKLWVRPSVCLAAEVLYNHKVMGAKPVK